MRDDPYLLAVLADLEMQADGLRMAERAEEVDELSAAGYADVDLDARWHGSTGAVLRLELVDGIDVRGTLRRAGPGWVLIDAGTSTAVVRTATVVAVHGLGTEAVAPAARGLTARLSVASVLRGVAQAGNECVVRLVGGGRHEGALERVGADFIELVTPADRVVIPFAGICVVQERR